MNLEDIRSNVELGEVSIYGQACWLWKGCVISNGYASVRYLGRSTVAHKVIYESMFGPVPVGLELDHLCRTRRCINPMHLQPVTRKVNLLRSPIALAAINAKKTHCKNGHELSGDNLRIEKGNKRRCRMCDTENWKKANERKRQRRQGY